MRFVDLAHYTAIDWFRSVPAPSPILTSRSSGPASVALRLEAQQLTVVLSPGGTVVRYEVHSSLNRLHAAGQATTGYAK